MSVFLHNIINRFCVISFLFLMMPLSGFAVTLAQYRENIQSAKDYTLELLYPDDEDMSAAVRLNFERENLAGIRQVLPKNEKVEWRETIVETDNEWLNDKLDVLEKESEDSPKRELILNEIYERLDSIELGLEELEKPTAQTRSKDEDKRKLAEILRREEFQKPDVKTESLFKRILRKIWQWLRDLFPKPNLPETSAGGFEGFSFVLQVILYALVLGGIGFLIYRFAPFLTALFRRGDKQDKQDRVILGERLSATETGQNLFNQAEQLARDGNLRGAIRKGYIALLCELSDRKIIGLAQHKTNRDYLRDVRQKQELYENMNGLTSNFERHWYGFEAANETDWEDFRQNYKKALNAG